MANPDYLPPRPWMQRKGSSSSLAGLEIAIPPGQKAPQSPGPSLYSEYSEKALPPIPSKSKHRSRLSYESYEDMDRDDLSSLTSKTSKSSQKVFQLMGVHVDTDTTRDPPRPRSRMSLSSLGSQYSDDDVKRKYATAASVMPPPRRRSSVDDLQRLKKKSVIYLQAVTYSASAPKIPRETPKLKNISDPLKPEPLSLRPKDRVQSASPHSKSDSRNRKGGGVKPSRPRSPARTQTLEEMIAHERKRYEAEELARKIWKPTIGKPEARNFEDRARSPAPNMANVSLPVRPAPRLAPPPRLNLEESEDRRQSISHFSDQSDEESPGVMANARDSVMSHLRRNVKSPSPKTPHHAASSGENHKSPTKLKPPPASKRKRLSSKGKHPLRSPFPFPKNYKNKKQQWPPPTQHQTKSTTPSFSKRLSGVMRRFSTGSGPSPGQVDPSPLRSSSIITTEARDADGPDTPPPMSSASHPDKVPGTGLTSNFKLPSPKFMKDLTTAGIGGEKSMSGKEILEKGSMRFADAIESAKKKAGVKSKAEKRREHIRANIVKIGQADQFPDGRVNRWL